MLRGQAVEVQIHDTTISGISQGLDDSGQLVLQVAGEAAPRSYAYGDARLLIG